MRPDYMEAYARWQAHERQYWADAPDPGSDREADYVVQEIPFGADSTALATAPRPLRQGGRHYDLTPDSES